MSTSLHNLLCKHICQQACAERSQQTAHLFAKPTGTISASKLLIFCLSSSASIISTRAQTKIAGGQLPSPKRAQQSYAGLQSNTCAGALMCTSLHNLLCKHIRPQAASLPKGSCRQLAQLVVLEKISTTALYNAAIDHRLTKGKRSRSLHYAELLRHAKLLRYAESLRYAGVLQFCYRNLAQLCCAKLQSLIAASGKTRSKQRCYLFCRGSVCYRNLAQSL